MKHVPLSLYVHLPWCVRKCPYCDFNSHTAGDNAPRARYLQALIADIRDEAQRSNDRELISVFLGGGTPSLFTPAEIGELLSAVQANFRLAGNCEITMEANPGTIECGDPAGYRAAGVNRLSIGAQSFTPRSLTLLGRIHTVPDISRAVDEARAAGFDAINLDLMYGLPEQDTAAALADIEAALALGTSHLSWYQLTLEPNTVFHARPPAGLPDENSLFETMQAGGALLVGKGFEQYEVSAWARDGRQCRHNLNYWSFGDYLAVGAGAHGKRSDEAGVRRYAKPANPLSYMESIETGELPPPPPALGESELVFEFMLNALRLSGGFSQSLFEDRTGLKAEVLERSAKKARSRHLIEVENSGNWRPTSLGRRFLNDLMAEFLPG
jgi:oxygen-independent coproporphyrinogen-3 oxidase